MRKPILLAVRILVSAVLLYLALRGIDFATVKARLDQISGFWLTLTVLATLVQILLGAWRWHEITRRCDAPLTGSQAARYNLIGAFFNQTLPSTIGGDALRLWLLKQTGAGWRAATYSVLIDRAVGFIALSVIVVISLPWSYQLIGNTQGRLALVAIDAGAVAAGAGFLLLSWLPWPWLRTMWPFRHLYVCSEIANKVLFSTESGPKVVLLSLAIHAMTVVIAWFAVLSISARAGFDQLFLLIPPIMLITMLPISIAGWGLREATMMVAFGYAGLSRTDGTVVSLVFGASFFLVGIVGGLVWVLSTEKANAPPNAIGESAEEQGSA